MKDVLVRNLPAVDAIVVPENGVGAFEIISVLHPSGGELHSIAVPKGITPSELYELLGRDYQIDTAAARC